MSKSEGRIVLVKDLLDGPGAGPLQGMVAARRGEVIRLALLSGHYRQALEWSDVLLEQAKARLDRWYRALQEIDAAGEDAAGEPPADFLAALFDDLNTPRAIAALDGLAKATLSGGIADMGKRKHAFRVAGALLGVLRLPWESWAKNRAVRNLRARVDLSDPADPRVHLEVPRHETFDADTDDARIGALIEARKAAKAAKDFVKADRIRDDLAAEGIVLEDRPGGVTEWRRG